MEEKMENNFKTVIFIDKLWNTDNAFGVEYSFNRNCWIIKKAVSINIATKIANELKRKYYEKKQWVISWANKKIEVRFINEMEHL